MSPISNAELRRVSGRSFCNGIHQGMNVVLDLLEGKEGEEHAYTGPMPDELRAFIDEIRTWKVRPSEEAA